MKIDIESFVHDLNNHLTIIRGHLGISQRFIHNNPEKAEAHLVKSINSIDACTELCISTFESREETVDLEEFLNKLVSDVKGLFNMNFDLFVQNNVVMNNLDPVLLKNCLINLYKNAYEAGAQSALIRLSQYELVFIDDGPGFPAEMLEDVNKFISKKNEIDPSHGHGIRSALKFCESMSWKLTFENAKSRSLGGKVSIKFNKID